MLGDLRSAGWLGQETKPQRRVPGSGAVGERYPGSGLRSGFANIPDHRSDEVDISLPDALMSGFAMFSLTSPSLLAFDKQRVEGNLETIYGIPHAPCDTRMRERLDPVSPESLRASFKSVFRQLQRGKALEEMVFLDGYYLFASR